MSRLSVPVTRSREKKLTALREGRQCEEERCSGQS